MAEPSVDRVTGSAGRRWILGLAPNVLAVESDRRVAAVADAHQQGAVRQPSQPRAEMLSARLRIRVAEDDLDVSQPHFLDIEPAPGQPDGVQFIGIDDAESKSQVATEITKLQPSLDKYRILLYHRPDRGEAAAAWGVDLMLTGHTHRGQLVPFNLLVKRVFPRLYRDYKIGDMTLYVSPGTGTWGPVMRLGSKCEITLIELM